MMGLYDSSNLVSVVVAYLLHVASDVTDVLVIRYLENRV